MPNFIEGRNSGLREKNPPKKGNLREKKNIIESQRIIADQMHMYVSKSDRNLSYSCQEKVNNERGFRFIKKG